MFAHLSSCIVAVFMRRLESMTSDFPDESDLEGAATALMRLQDTYALCTDKIAKGELQGVTNSPELSGKSPLPKLKISIIPTVIFFQNYVVPFLELACKLKS